MKMRDIINIVENAANGVEGLDIPATVDKEHLVAAIREFAKSDMYNGGLFLYRGGKYKDKWLYNVPPKGIRTRPRDTPVNIHDIVNKEAVTELGYAVRNGVFATPDFSIAGGYGDEHLIIPTKDTIMIQNRYINDFTSYCEYETQEDSDGFSDFLITEFEIEDISEIDELGISINKLLHDYVTRVLVPDYISNLKVENLNTNDIDENNEVMLFGEFYVIPIDMANKLFKSVGIEIMLGEGKKVKDIMTEDVEKYLSDLKSSYFADKGTYNNASHKFFSIRKKLASSDTGFASISPSQFFDFIKSKKVASPEPTEELDEELIKRKNKFRSIFGKDPSDSIIDEFTNYKNGTVSASKRVVDLFNSDSSNDSATKKFYKAWNKVLSDEDWFGRAIGITPNIFFNFLKKDNAEKRSARIAAMDTGDWDDKMHIDQVERTIKGWRRGF